MLGRVCVRNVSNACLYYFNTHARMNVFGSQKVSEWLFCVLLSRVQGLDGVFVFDSSSVSPGPRPRHLTRPTLTSRIPYLELRYCWRFCTSPYTSPCSNTRGWLVSLSLVHIHILLFFFVLSSLRFALSSSLHRASAGGSVLSAACGRLSVGRSLGRLTPRQLGDEDEIDEDVKAEADRVANGGADRDVVKVRFLCFDCLLIICWQTTFQSQCIALTIWKRRERQPRTRNKLENK